MYTLIDGDKTATFLDIDDARSALAQAVTSRAYIVYTERAVERFTPSGELAKKVTVADLANGNVRLYRVMITFPEGAARSRIVPASSYDEAIEQIRPDYPDATMFDAWQTH